MPWHSQVAIESHNAAGNGANIKRNLVRSSLLRGLPAVRFYSVGLFTQPVPVLQHL